MTKATFMVWMFLAAFVGAQIAPSGDQVPEKYRPTENWQVFKGAKTYYVYDNPMIPDKSNLQSVAAALEKYAGLRRADTAAEADVVVRCFQVIKGRTVLYTQPTYGGVVTTTRRTPDYYHYQLMHGDEVVYGWTPPDYYHGAAFGKKVGKKIAKINK